MEPEAAADTVVLIHGLWMTPLSWEHWVARYEQRGLKVFTPGYPGIEAGGATTPAARTGGKRSLTLRSTGHSPPRPEISTKADHACAQNTLDAKGAFNLPPDWFHNRTEL
jgi:hypothetical protein